MKYLNEFMRAAKIALFLALGVFIGTGIVPWAMSEDKAAAKEGLVGAAFGIMVPYMFVVAALFVSEVVKTKRRQKRAAQKHQGKK